MKIIAHRANIKGPNSCKENSPEAIQYAISLGFDVEIDVRLRQDAKLWLGHDQPEYATSLDFLESISSRLWIHCKDIPTLAYFLTEAPDLHVFFHQDDDCTLTSQNIIWQHPKSEAFLTPKTVLVMPEISSVYCNPQCYGICTDYPEKFFK